MDYKDNDNLIIKNIITHFTFITHMIIILWINKIIKIFTTFLLKEDQRFIS
jgi:hypothetical protein